MATQEVILAGNYNAGGQDISLTITIGDAQMGVSAIYLDSYDNDPVIVHQETKKLEGSGKSKIIKIKTVVTDTNDQTNHTSVTYMISGGADGSKEISAQKTVVDNGDSVLYYLDIKLS